MAIAAATTVTSGRIDTGIAPEQPMKSVARNRQQVLAIFLPISATLLVIGTALTPRGLDQLITSQATALTVLPIAVAHTNLLYVSNLLHLCGLGALGVSFAAIATLVRDRGAALATTAAVIGGFGAICGAIGNVLPGFNLAATVTAQLSPEVAAQYLVATFTSPVGEAILVGYLGSLLVGTILMAIALWRSPSTPRWLPFLFAIGLTIAALAPAGIVAIPLQLPFAAAMAILASRIWQMAARPAVGASR
jgi:hypothetical protein